MAGKIWRNLYMYIKFLHRCTVKFIFIVSERKYYDQKTIRILHATSNNYAVNNVPVNFFFFKAEPIVTFNTYISNRITAYYFLLIKYNFYMEEVYLS